MKKSFILLAAMTMFVSCSQTEIIDEIVNESINELTLSTKANQTRAIAEGTNVPTGNVIGLYTNFHSDENSRNFSNYNDIRNFGYHYNKQAWRGANSAESLSQLLQNLSIANTNFGCLLDELMTVFYRNTPVYWPAGDNVNLDYTAFSSSNLVSIAGQMLNLYLSDELAEYGDIMKMLEQYIALNPTKVNPNRMDIGYNFSAFNYLPYAMNIAFDGAYIEPEAIVIILALCVLTDTPTGFPNVDVHLSDLHPIIENCFSNGQLDMEKAAESISSVESLITELNLQDIITFYEDYRQACRQLKEPYAIIDNDKEKALSQERVEEVMSKAYWIFMTRMPLISKYLQDDLMYAYDRNLRNDTRGTVKATFNHAKAWVKVVVNNQTDKDIFVSGIAFNDVKTSGTLIVDNSKSEFEAYWDFTRPIYQQQPNMNSPESNFESYEAVNLDGESQPVPNSGNNIEGKPKQPSKAKGMKNVRKNEPVVGFIPDMYYAPAGCYGPAKNIETCKLAASAAVSGPTHGLKLEFLSGDQTFDTSVANNLGGAMFPAQEPGKIAIEYYAWDGKKQHSVLGEDKTHVIQTLEMGSTIQEWNKYLIKENRHDIELNLPRLRWEMGKVYIYVINISNNEITINPTVTDWDVTAAPIVYPDTDNSMIEDFGSNQLNPNWGWEPK